MKHGKHYVDAAKQVDFSKLYDMNEALELACKTASAKFDETVELHVRLGVDGRHADQQVRGAVVLPNGTGKTVRVCAIAKGAAAAAAEAAGADIVGDDELIARIAGGFMDFDVVVTTPDMMGRVGRLGKVLGPRGLMPNPKAGTVAPDLGKAVTEAKAGKIEYRLDKQNIIHVPVGKASFAGWQRVLELYRDVKMPDAEKRAEAFPHEMSGGMRQRVMIAMMISRKPQLLIADEPTTALDVTIEAQILDIISELKREFNTAIMLITHNFGLVAEVADKVAIMYAGEIVEQGDVFEIFDNPLHPYTRLLMKALPRVTKHQARLQTIDGTVPRITEKKQGCRFCNRCPYAKEICENTKVPTAFISPTHSYSCHFVGEGK